MASSPATDHRRRLHPQPDWLVEPWMLGKIVATHAPARLARAEALEQAQDDATCSPSATWSGLASTS